MMYSEKKVYLCRINPCNKMDTYEKTTAAPSHKPRRFRWALWWGLGI